MTYTEDPNLEFVGLAHIASADLSLETTDPPDEPIEETYTPCGYIDLEDLHETLELYYSGQLDNVSDLTRLYLPLDQLIAGNSLASQLTNEDIEAALKEVSFKDEVFLEGYFKHDLRDTEQYAGAVLRLSEVIYKML